MKTRKIEIEKKLIEVKENDFLYYRDVLTGRKEGATGRIEYGLVYLLKNNRFLYYHLINNI